MKIIVDGKEAVLKEGSSFEYHMENPMLTEAEDYTMEMEFPIKDCPQNIAIFGAMHIKGADVDVKHFNCEIITDTFQKKGILVITGVNDVDVKAQFLAGVSSQYMYSDLPDDLLLTDMDFSDYDGTGGEESFTHFEGEGFEDMPVWDTAQERVIYGTDGAPGMGNYRSRHIYLYHLIEIVANLSIGFSVDMSALNALPLFRKVVVVNVIQPKYARSGHGVAPLNKMLPKWSVRKFFEEVANFFGCVVDVQSVYSKIVFTPINDYFANNKKITLDVLDDFSVEVGKDDEIHFVGNKQYKLPDECNENNINTCPWFVSLQSNSLPIYYDRAEVFIYPNSDYTLDSWGHQAYHYNSQLCPNKRTLYKIIEKIQDPHTYWYEDEEWGDAVITGWEEVPGELEGDPPKAISIWAEIINQYGGTTEGEELGIAPCPLTIRNMKRIIGQYGDPVLTASQNLIRLPAIEVPKDYWIEFINNDYLPVKDTFDILSDGEPNAFEYYDKLWVVLHSGEHDDKGYNVYTRKYEGRGALSPNYPDLAPYLAGFQKNDFTLSPFCPSILANRGSTKVDESKLYRYKFLSDTLPDSKAIYVINNKEYVCKRLTAHFNTKGMSQLIEGEFYEVVV